MRVLIGFATQPQTQRDPYTDLLQARVTAGYPPFRMELCKNSGTRIFDNYFEYGTFREKRHASR
ncbi:MAG: hypothetical protein WDM86_03990 [Rhizomicrobium sp.]